VASAEGCILSASNDGTARIWDLRTNKGAILLKHSGEKKAIVKAKYLYGGKGVLTVSGNNVNLFDLRKPSLIIS
jgi:WD40 repeat protein